MPRVENMTGFIDGPCLHPVLFFGSSGLVVICSICSAKWETARDNFIEIDLGEDDKRIAPLSKENNDTDELVKAITEQNPEALFADGFEGALISVGIRCGQPTLAVYSYSKAVDILITRDGMSYEDAVEWMDFNVVGAWMGEHTPMWTRDNEC